MFEVKIKSLKAIKDHILVKNMNFGERVLNSGIVMLGDDKKTDGIRPRWAQVFATGSEQKDIQVGQWILVEHGRWTRGCKVDINGEELVLRRVDADAILLVSDQAPATDDNISTSVHANQLSRS
jgi:hypothetical protein